MLTRLYAYRSVPPARRGNAWVAPVPSGVGLEAASNAARSNRHYSAIEELFFAARGEEPLHEIPL